MGAKFDAIFESVIHRYSAGGYLPGDLVKFRPSYKSTATYEAMHSVMKQELDELVNSGLNIKVVQVSPKMPGMSAGTVHKSADSVVITVAGDHGGGRWYNAITVTPEMIDIVTGDDYSQEVPDQFYRKDETNFKPEVFKPDATHITRQTDKGTGKNTPTNLKLAGESARMKVDNDEMGMIYENIDEKDFTPIYEQVLITEGLLRRMATKLSGGFKSNPLQKTNQSHQFAKSIAYDVGKDISKTFGGTPQQHTPKIYQFILDYLKTNSLTA